MGGSFHSYVSLPEGIHHFIHPQQFPALEVPWFGGAFWVQPLGPAPVFSESQARARGTAEGRAMVMADL